MPRSLPVQRRLTTAARWPVGVALTSWRYLWRTVPLHRGEEAGDPRTDAPPPPPRGAPRTAARPPPPAGVELGDVQRPEDGAGPVFHRRYRTRIRDAELTAREL